MNREEVEEHRRALIEAAERFFDVVNETCTGEKGEPMRVMFSLIYEYGYSMAAVDFALLPHEEFYNIFMNHTLKLAMLKSKLKELNDNYDEKH